MYLKQVKIIYFAFVFMAFLISVQLNANLKLPKLINDGMVLQQNTELKIWGWTAPKQEVVLQFKTLLYRTVANDEGEWEIKLPKQKAGGPYTMRIISNDTVVVNDILIGDVWICSGQSNMEMSMERVSPIYEKEIAESQNDYIRYFEVDKKYNFNHTEKDISNGFWKKANPENLLKFSAVAYFFAKELYDKYKIPIGLINASLGGSPAEAWLSEDAIKAFPHYYEELQKFKDSSLIKEIESKDNARIQTWYKALQEKDKGYKDSLGCWRNPELNISDWKVMKIPGYWADTELGQVNGIVWFRKEIDIPQEAAGKSARLILGRIVDADSVFINGVFIGTTSYQYPPRRYNIPNNVLKAGKNTIVVKVISNSGKGGFVLDKSYEIIIDGQKYDLQGEWYYNLGAKIEPLMGQTFIRWKPVGLYNAMIAPLINYKIKGVIWYQGESNANRPIEYRTLFPALINNWRNKWNQGNFPFLFVQLPNFMEARELPSESGWALLREAQLKTLSLPNTGMAVAIDIGEWNDIHPLNKKDVGKRLALAARKVAYGDKKVVSSGPIYKSMKLKDNKVILSFDNIGSGLIAKATELKHFAVAGPDKIFVWAKAVIKNNKVIVWNDSIPNPIAVRYAWADNPEGANLYNKEGLPASPFRTDDFD